MNNIIIEVAKNTARIILNRPEVHNAFNAEMIKEMTDAFNSIAKDEKIETVILKSSSKNFCAGGDLTWMKEAASYDHAKNVADAEGLAEMLFALYSMPQTTICCTSGAVYGGGVGLVSACDIAIGLNNTKFCLSEVKLGLVPAVISPYVINAMGGRICKRLFTTAESFSAKEAENFGLLQNTYIENDDLETALEGILANLNNNAPKAKKVAKSLIPTFENQPISLKTASQSARIIADVREGDEAKEGISAFLEKRMPNWSK